MTIALIFLVTGAVSGVLTGLVRRYAISRQVVDIPNARSSHSTPTPRGGGIAVAFVFLLSLPILYGWGLIQLGVLIGLFGAGTFVAVVGFLDDRGSVAAGWRLLSHLTAAIWALWWLGPLPPLELPSGPVHLGWAAYVLAVLYLVWMLNLYNFMDGIDGIAGIEAVTVCIAGALLAWIAAASVAMVLLPLLLAAAAAGFLVWNFPPARIFMGDAGSGFLGVMLGLLSLLAAQAVPVLFWAWVILLGTFVVDATTTLLRRLRRRQRPHEAHRSHAYQYASRRLGAHRPVSLTVGAINLFWLFPWALAVTMGWMDGVVAVIVAYAPLVMLAFRLKAGAPELQEI